MGTPTVKRQHFVQQRRVEFLTQDGFRSQTGFSQREDWLPGILKELLDNSLDACEEAGVVPSVAVDICSGRLAVSDNGPGLPQDIIPEIVNFDVSVSSRAAYVAPDRGAQGNALKTAVALPYVLDPEEGGEVRFYSEGECTVVRVAVDRIKQLPVVDLERSPAERSEGTLIEIRFNSEVVLQRLYRGRCVAVFQGITLLNPHLSGVLRMDDAQMLRCPASRPDFKKWTPAAPTSALWYGDQEFERLFISYLTRRPDMTVTEFVKLFRDMSRQTTEVTRGIGLGKGAKLRDLVVEGELLDEVAQLRRVLQAHSKPVDPQLLGVLGRDNLRERLRALFGVDETGYQYRKKSLEVEGDDFSRPMMIEAAFAPLSSEDQDRIIISGANFSATQKDMFGLGYNVLAQQHIGYDSPVLLVVHIALPRPPFDGRGKASLQLPAASFDVIRSLVVEATTKWKRYQEKVIKRGGRVDRQRELEERKRTAVPQNEAFSVCIKDAYMKASSGGKLPALQRQIYYVIRPWMLELCEVDRINYGYFTTLLDQYLNEHEEETDAWNIHKDPRGNLIEPHSDDAVPLGTAGVEAYVRKAMHEVDFDQIPRLQIHASTSVEVGPRNKYGAVLYIEKEGFGNLLKASHFCERYDIAVMSSKGYMGVAAKTLIDTLCEHYDIPVFIVHDFDVAGIEIARTIQEDTARYRFRNRIQVFDLGLRLDDVEAMELQHDPEAAKLSDKQRTTLVRLWQDEKITDEEYEFLKADQRVELNAMTTEELLGWLKGKMEEHGVEKVIGEPEAMEAHWRGLEFEHAVGEAAVELEARIFGDEANPPVAPRDAHERVRELLEDDPSLSWQQALGQVFRDELDNRAHFKGALT